MQASLKVILFEAVELGERLRGWARPICGQLSKNTKRVEQVSTCKFRSGFVLVCGSAVPGRRPGRASDIHWSLTAMVFAFGFVSMVSCWTR